MKISSIHRSRALCAVPAALAAAGALALVACGGGAAVSGTPATPTSVTVTMQGSAVDAPIAGAQITITAGAPLGAAAATTIGSVIANASGQFTVSVSLPAGSVPVFANAQDPANTAVVLSSYLGQSDALAAAGALTSTSVPDLDLSPVTTAALAVYAQVNGGSDAGLSAAAYAGVQSQYRGDILAIAAAVKAVGDQLCTPSLFIGTTTNLAATIAAGSNLTSGNSTTLATAAALLGGNCASVLATLPQTISADPTFGPELDMGSYTGATSPALAAGTYQLQGVIAETTGGDAEHAASASTAAATPLPASLFVDGALTVSASGVISSADGLVSGTLAGRLLTLQVTNGTQQYSLRGDIGAVPAALVGGGTAYALHGGGSNTASALLASFEAVIVPEGASPVWNGIAAPTTATTAEGVSCAAGTIPLRLDGFGSQIGGGSFGECVAPSANGWTMSAATGSNASYYFEQRQAAGATPPNWAAPSWAAPSTAAPFVLESAASITYNATTTSGTAYYVMGTSSIVFATSAGNNLLGLQGQP